MRGGGWSSALVVLSSCVFTRRQIPCATQGSSGTGMSACELYWCVGCIELLHVGKLGPERSARLSVHKRLKKGSAMI